MRMSNQPDHLLSHPKHWSEHFTRENVISVLKNLAWVVPLTILIWIYAEREQIATEPGRVIPIDVRTTAPNRIVTLITPADKNIVAELAGPRAQLEKVLGILSRPGENDSVPVTIDIDPSLPPGTKQTIPTARVAESPLFTSLGITVSDCRPALLTVQVDALVEKEVPVKLLNPIASLEAPPTFTPATVKLRGPQSSFENGGGGNLAVYANLSDLPELKISGERTINNVPLMLPSTLVGDTHVTMTPKSVSAHVKVKQVEGQLVYDTMTIFVTTPYNFSDRYKVKLLGDDPFIHNVTLLGPPDVLAAMKKEDFHPKPVARVTVTSDDLPPGVRRTRELKFELPDGVRVAEVDSHRSVEFMIVDATKE